jgi:hypothetical protein
MQHAQTQLKWRKCFRIRDHVHTLACVRLRAREVRGGAQTGWSFNNSDYCSCPCLFCRETKEYIYMIHNNTKERRTLTKQIMRCQITLDSIWHVLIHFNLTQLQLQGCPPYKKSNTNEKYYVRWSTPNNGCLNTKDL